MFKIVNPQNQKFKVLVQIPVPTEDGVVTEEATLIFRRAGTSAQSELLKQTTGDVVRAQLIGWEGVADESGNEVAFTPEHLEGFLQIPTAVQAAAVAFFETNNAAKEKN